MNNLEYSYLEKNNASNKQLIQIDSENNFFIQLYNEFDNTKYFLIKSHNKYCNIDFSILEFSTLKNVYLEYKDRSKKYYGYSFPTFPIDKTKLEMINLNYNDCFIILQFKDDLYYTKFNKDYLKSNVCRFGSSLVYEIPKINFKTGFDNLIKSLKDELKPYNTY